MEVQGKMQELSRALRQISMRLQMNEREMRKCKITVQDLGTLPPTTPMYRAAGSIGRLVVLFLMVLRSNVCAPCNRFVT